MKARLLGRAIALLALGALADVVRADPRDVGLDCFSTDGKVKYCKTHAIGLAKLVRQFSQERCVQYRTWGADGDGSGIWVTGGCRGRFVVTRGRPFATAKPTTITCSSKDGAYQHCATPTWGHRIWVEKQLGATECKQGDNWGLDFKGIWVERGCSAEFAVT